MNLYICKDIHRFDYKLYLNELSEQRLKKIENIPLWSSKNQSAAAFVLLHRALKTDFQIAALPEFDLSETLKPTLKNCPDICFNLSHTDGSVACVVGRNENGVDIQKIRPVSEQTVLRTLSPRENAAVMNCEDKDAQFITFWTKKEAYLKKQGKGVGLNLNTIDTFDLEDVFTFRFENTVVSAFGEKTEKIVFIDF